jgi:DNA-binding transcriptional MerR regulator
MDKSPDAFRTISEVADELDLPQHVLRFWETKFPQIKPLKRGGGRRYYRPNDVDLLKGIRQLLYGEGYTIRGVQRILKSEGVRFMESLGRGEQVLGRRAAEAQDHEAERAQGEDTAFDAQDFDGGDTERGSSPPPGAPASREDEGRAAALDLGQLQAALDELRECQRLLEGLRETGDLETEASRG